MNGQVMDQGAGAGVEVSPEVVQKARSMGWSPQEEYRGDPGKWIDAAEFVARGETMLPLVRAHSKKLEATVAAQNAELRKLREAQQASQEALSAMEEFYREDTKRQVERERARIKAELVQATKDGNAELAVELQDQLTGLKIPDVPKKTEVTKPAAQQAQVVDPAFEAWAARNPWFGVDMSRTYQALAVAQRLRDSGEVAHLNGDSFFERVSLELEGKKQVTQPKVGTGRTTDAGGGSGTGKKGYSDLPAEAKEACAKQAKKVVGPNRAFKDVAAWQAQYAKIYFQGEE